MIYEDQLKRKVDIPSSPKRIISLVPSQTELLSDLGLDEVVVGITKFCIHPAYWRKEKVIVGGTKQLHYDRINALKPDLIIANKEENNKEDIEYLNKRYPVWISDITVLSEALNMILQIGEIVNKKDKAIEMNSGILDGFNTLPSYDSLRVAYFIWQKPYMVAAANTFIDNLLYYAGFENIFSFQDRYPEVTLEEIADLNPDIILLSSEPYPFKQKHFEVFHNACPDSKVSLVDGEMFSWYGSRLQLVPAYIRKLRRDLLSE